jgi:hypothetical protein
MCYGTVCFADSSGGSESGTLSFAQRELPPSLTPLSLGEPKIIYYCQRAQRHLRMFSREQSGTFLPRVGGRLAVRWNGMLGAHFDSLGYGDNGLRIAQEESRRLGSGSSADRHANFDCMRVRNRQFSRTEIARRSNNAGSSNLINVAAFYFGRVSKLRHQ